MGSGRKSSVNRAGTGIPGVRGVRGGQRWNARTVYCLRGGGGEFYAVEQQVEGARSPGVDTVKVRFRGSKSDQGRKGAALVRTKGDGSKEDKPVEFLQELY